MSASAQSILAVNAGSSSLKFALYPCQPDGVGDATLTGTIEGLEPGGAARLRVNVDGKKSEQALHIEGENRFDAALQALDALLEEHARHAGHGVAPQVVG